MTLFGMLITLFFFFFNDTATTEIYTLSLHDALPISSALVTSSDTAPIRPPASISSGNAARPSSAATTSAPWPDRDRKSTRLNSSHGYISYAVFCLKKKKQDRSVITRVELSSLYQSG